MFLGHIAVGLAAKRAAPRVSLAILVGSAQFLDLLWPIFVLVGLEHVRIDPGNTPVTPLDFYDYPISHSALTAAGWALLVAALVGMRRYGSRAALVAGLLVLSHWVLDVISHRPDMPLLPWGGPDVGLGLWYSRAATMLVEIAMYGGGIALYLRSVPGARSRPAFWIYVAVLAALYAANLFGPPPPGVRALAWGSLGTWVLVAWTYWVDRRVAAPRGIGA